MKAKALYYIPMEGKRNKAGTTNLTIGWFKKFFKPPIDNTSFEQLNVIDECVDNLPQLGWVISFEMPPIITIVGVVEKIILKRTLEDETYYILLNPVK